MKVRTLHLVTFLGLAALAQAQSTEIPASLQPPAGQTLILKTHAAGWQIYTCGADSDGKPAWTLKAPEADLYDASGKLVGHHKAGPSWVHRDGSVVTGKAAAHVDSPDPKSIPWLLLSATGHTGEGSFAKVSSIQRVHTEGGLAPPASECDPGKPTPEVRSSYAADYYFYAPAK